MKNSFVLSRFAQQYREIIIIKIIIITSNTVHFFLLLISLE
jgi:hypothetical protein